MRLNSPPIPLFAAVSLVLGGCASGVETTAAAGSESSATTTATATTGPMPTSAGASDTAGSGGPTTATTSETTAASAATETSGGASATDSDSDSGETSGETSGGGEPTDAELLFQAIEGELDPGDALQQIADSDGLPIAGDGDVFYFACLCGPGVWSLAGDFNGWSPQVMSEAGALRWIAADVPAPDGAKYKFVDAVDSYIADPMGRRYGYDAFGEYSLVRASAPHLERWYNMRGFGLGPRDLQVYVPQGGQFSHAIYAADGQNLFDPGAIWGGWGLQESLPGEMLVVGVDNTAARMDEYTHVADELQGEAVGGKGPDYAKLVHELIRPRMEAAYGAAELTAVMGSSLGGLISLFIADRYPDDYDMVISMSGTVGWGSIGDGVANPTILDIYEQAGKRPFAIYLDSGGGDGGMACVDADLDGVADDNLSASDNYCVNIQLRDALIDLGYTFDVDLWHWWEPDAPHNEIAWGERVGIPLGYFAGL
ncbi:MAG: alpha/beta hydrolase-fold protein [Nannocystaceae bacterium]